MQSLGCVARADHLSVYLPWLGLWPLFTVWRFDLYTMDKEAAAAEDNSVKVFIAQLHPVVDSCHNLMPAHCM